MCSLPRHSIAASRAAMTPAALPRSAPVGRRPSKGSAVAPPESGGMCSPASSAVRLSPGRGDAAPAPSSPKSSARPPRARRARSARSMSASA
eukprot:1259690-Pleurochrysis_carterae.AAC.1